MDFQKLTLKPLLQHLQERFDESEEQKAVKVPGPKSKDRKAYDAAKSHLADFLRFAQAYLDRYQPMSTIMLEQGFGCTLQDGQPVCLANARELQPMHDEGIGITQGRNTGMLSSGTFPFGSK
jgi:hypothetical protein